MVHNQAVLLKLSAAFFAQPGSDPPSQPVRDWLRHLPKEDRVEIGSDIQAVQLGWPLRMPLVKHLRGDLWEVRSTLDNSDCACAVCGGGQHYVSVAWLHQDEPEDATERTGARRKALEADQTVAMCRCNPKESQDAQEN